MATLKPHSNGPLLVHWLLMGGLLHLVAYSDERTGRAGAPSSPLLAVPTVTAQPSTASVPTREMEYKKTRAAATGLLSCILTER